MSLYVLNNRKIKCIIVLGSQGFDAGELLEILPDTASKELLLLMHRDDLQHSMKVLVANAAALSDTSARLHYFSTIERGAAIMGELTRHAIDGGFDALLIANFGVKPLTLPAYKAAKVFQLRTKRFGQIGDLLTLSMHNYGSVYSIGCGETSAYEHDMVEDIK
jgi:hypothetical protein